MTNRPITDFEIKLIQGLKNRHHSAAVHIRDIQNLDGKTQLSPNQTMSVQEILNQKQHHTQEEMKYQFLVDEIQKIFDEAKDLMPSGTIQ